MGFLAKVCSLAESDKVDWLEFLGLPVSVTWSEKDLVVVSNMSNLTISLLLTVVTTLIGYYIVRGRSNSARRKKLQKELQAAQQTVHDLEEKLVTLEALDLAELKGEGREIRLFMDGAFDMMHYGHMNAFRQARALGSHLIVGINSDETITACKGKPVNTDEERLATVRACKWVDEVITGVPYVMNEQYLLSVIEKYNIDYVVHGDDPCIVDGKDVYESARKLGKYLTIPRTEGISTTDIVGRMLLMTRSHHSSAESDIDDHEKRPRGGSFGVSMSPSTSTLRESFPSFGSLPGTSTPPLESPERPPLLPESKLASKSTGEFNRKSNFLTTSRTVRLFGAGVKAPVAENKVIYLHGSWDMFHAGHVSILEKARSLGDYVIVGVHNDAVVNQHCGTNLPIMNLQERVLSVLGCKFVDDVLIDAPPVITKEMIDYLHIHLVVKGSLMLKYVCLI